MRKRDRKRGRKRTLGLLTFKLGNSIEVFNCYCCCCLFPDESLVLKLKLAFLVSLSSHSVVEFGADTVNVLLMPIKMMIESCQEGRRRRQVGMLNAAGKQGHHQQLM